MVKCIRSKRILLTWRTPYNFSDSCSYKCIRAPTTQNPWCNLLAYLIETYGANQDDSCIGRCAATNAKSRSENSSNTICVVGYLELDTRYVLALELWFWHMIQDSWLVPQITLTDSADSYTRKKREVEQHSRIGGYECVPSLLEQGPRRTAASFTNKASRNL